MNGTNPQMIADDATANPVAHRRAATLASAVEATGALAVLLIGDCSHPEMAQVVPCLAESCRLSRSQNLAVAKAAIAAVEVPPELIVISQVRPGEHRPTELAAIRALAPLAGLCVVLGSQCEGETRSGQPLPGVPRIFWHAWPTFWQEQQDRLSRGLLPAWSLPATVGEDERMLAAAGCPWQAERQRRVAVLAASRESARALADAVRTGGHIAEIASAGTDATTPAADVVLWDTSPAALGNLRQVQAIKRQFSGAVVIGVITFPRSCDMAAAAAAGITAVIAKPFRLEHLLAAIECK